MCLLVLCIQRLVSVGMDQHATINVWDWKRGKIIATARGHSDKVTANAMLLNFINLLSAFLAFAVLSLEW